MVNFQDELTKLINEHSIENVSNTPDFVLSKFLMGCLLTFDVAVARRDRPTPDVTPSEALFGFVAWLTTRTDPVTFGASHNASPACDLVGEFCKVNSLPEPREGIYPNNLTMPKDGNPL